MRGAPEALATGLVALVVGSACAGYDNAFLDRSQGFKGEHVTDVSVADVPVHGFHVVVVRNDDNDDVEGELVAVDDEQIHVRPLNEESFVPTSWAKVKEVRLKIVPSRPGEPAGSIVWTTVGTLSTLSHGFFLVLSAPVWLSAGIPTSVVHGHSIHGKVEGQVSGNELRRVLYQFARYPQGLPRMPPSSPRPTPTTPAPAPTPAPSSAPSSAPPLPE